jgi:hypothetical protein
MDPIQALTALSRMVAVAVEHGKQVGALVLQVVVQVKIQLQHRVHHRKDLPERRGQARQVQLVQGAVAERAQLEFVGSFIRNIQALNALLAVMVATGFNIQSQAHLLITAVAAVAVQTITPAQLSSLGVAAMVVAAMEQTMIVPTELRVKPIQVAAVAVATGKQAVQMVAPELS